MQVLVFVCVCVWVNWCLRLAHIFCRIAVRSACVPFIHVWQIKSYFPFSVLSTIYITDILCHIWLSCLSSSLRAAGTSSAASCLSFTAVFLLLVSCDKSQKKTVDKKKKTFCFLTHRTWRNIFFRFKHKTRNGQKGLLKLIFKLLGHL